MNSIAVIFVLFVAIAVGQNNYTAASIQYPPRGWEGISYTELLLYNFPFVEADMIEAKDGGAELAVLPEGTFYWPAEGNRNLMESFCENLPEVFNGSPSINPCMDFTPEEKTSYPLLTAMSCMAIKLSMVVVVNMCDVQYCNASSQDCPTDGRNQYNTEIAISETGFFLAKYHKTHLAGEDTYFNQPAVPEVVYFDTSFGVRFGIFTCYDLEFNYPAESLLNEGITNFVYSASWVNTPPLFGAMIIQQGWSRARASNLIAGNSGASSTVAGGGVYSSGEALDSYFNPNLTSTDVVMIGTLPKKPAPPTVKKAINVDFSNAKDVSEGSEACDIYGLQGNCTYFTATPGLNGTISASTQGTLGSDISCSASFSVSATNPNVDVRYVLLAFSGYSLLPNTTSVLKMQSCLIFQCQIFNQSGLSCLPTWDSQIAFDYAQVSASNFEESVEILPLFGVEDAQIVSSSYIDFDSSAQTNISIITTENVGKSLYCIGILSLLAP